MPLKLCQQCYTKLRLYSEILDLNREPEPAVTPTTAFTSQPPFAGSRFQLHEWPLFAMYSPSVSFSTMVIVAVRYLLARAGHAPLCRGIPGFYMRAQVVAEKVLGLVPPIGYASLG